MTSVPPVVVARGLGHPEGPAALGDGGFAFVETFTGLVRQWSPAGGLGTIADVGGGPNACVTGAAGELYVTQNGGTAAHWRSDRPTPPSIQRIDGAAVSAILTEVEGRPLEAPNDLAFAGDGSLVFTDPGEYRPDAPGAGRIGRIAPDGEAAVVAELNGMYPNGIAALTDDEMVWVDSYHRGVYVLSSDGRTEELTRLPPGHIPDGVKVAIDGTIWVATHVSGNLVAIDRSGRIVDTIEVGGVPANLAFVGNGLLAVANRGDPPTPGGSHFGGWIDLVSVGQSGVVHQGSIRPEGVS